jgi:predicted nuclease of predicted toxin-antitoxin system
MARLYADEQYPYPVVEFLRTLGHDVLTVQEAGRANQKIPDSDVLAFATSSKRAVITENRKDFFRLHRIQPDHAGIIACTNDRDWEALAKRIHGAIAAEEPLQGKLIRVVRPGRSPSS